MFDITLHSLWNTGMLVNTFISCFLWRFTKDKAVLDIEMGCIKDLDIPG